MLSVENNLLKIKIMQMPSNSKSLKMAIVIIVKSVSRKYSNALGAKGLNVKIASNKSISKSYKSCFESKYLKKKKNLKNIIIYINYIYY